MPYPLFHVFMYVPVLEISMVLDASLPSFLRTRATIGSSDVAPLMEVITVLEELFVGVVFTTEGVCCLP